ncbi:hypothetical protein HanLR1_Chr00c0982g0786181 [Helianthus annuus]|nr:hypothetical protein HanLR1_Chr00c0982g0786181 [Helianthus annuus]
MIESERAYHQKVIQILDHLEGEVSSCRIRITLHIYTSFFLDIGT